MDQYPAAPLDCAQEDVNTLFGVLSDRLGFDCSSFINTEAAKNDKSASRHKESFKKKVENWLSKIQKDDEIILYLAGHGIVDSDGKLYLAMINCDGSNLDEAAIPMEWFRDKLGECPAKMKLIILDACHSGASKDNLV